MQGGDARIVEKQTLHGIVILKGQWMKMMIITTMNGDLGTQKILDLPRGMDYKLADVFGTVNALRGTKVKLKTIHQLLPDIDKSVPDQPLALEMFLPLECCHRPKCISIKKCNEFSYSETLVKRTFYYQYNLFENPKFSLCVACGKQETERLTSFLFDTKQNRSKFRHNIKTDLLGGLCCSNLDCRAVLYSYWIDIKHNMRLGFLTPIRSRTK